MVQQAEGADSNYHLEVVQSSERDYLRRCLDAEGIESSIHYPIPCHKQPAMENVSNSLLPVAERAAQRIISLPMGPHVTEDDTIRVAQAIARAFEVQDRSEGIGTRRKFAT
jgi:dTDP-4-amino-4,6-dideoxygalactose transaminase